MSGVTEGFSWRCLNYADTQMWFTLFCSVFHLSLRIWMHCWCVIHYTKQVPTENSSDKLAAEIDYFITPGCVVDVNMFGLSKGNWLLKTL